MWKAVLIPLVLLSVGCQEPQDPAWRQGGTSGDDTGPETGDCMPELGTVDAHIEDYPNVGWVIEVTAAFSDHGCSLAGGQVHLQVEEDGATVFDQAIPIDGTLAIIDEYDDTTGDGTLLVVVGGVEPGASYILHLSVENTQGYDSDVVVVDVD